MKTRHKFRPHFFKAHFSDKDSARKYSFILIEANLKPFNGDWYKDVSGEPKSEEEKRRHSVFVPLSSEEINSGHAIKVLSALRQVGGKNMGVYSMIVYPTNQCDSMAKFKIDSGYFDDKPEN